MMPSNYTTNNVSVNRIVQKPAAPNEQETTKKRRRKRRTKEEIQEDNDIKMLIKTMRDEERQTSREIKLLAQDLKREDMITKKLIKSGSIWKTDLLELEKSLETEERLMKGKYYVTPDAETELEDYFAKLHEEIFKEAKKKELANETMCARFLINAFKNIALENESKSLQSCQMRKKVTGKDLEAMRIAYTKTPNKNGGATETQKHPPKSAKKNLPKKYVKKAYVKDNVSYYW